MISETVQGLTWEKWPSKFTSTTILKLNSSVEEEDVFFIPLDLGVITLFSNSLLSSCCAWHCHPHSSCTRIDNFNPLSEVEIVILAPPLENGWSSAFLTIVVSFIMRSVIWKGEPLHDEFNIGSSSLLSHFCRRTQNIEGSSHQPHACIQERGVIFTDSNFPLCSGAS